jgi:cysteine desulfurase
MENLNENHVYLDANACYPMHACVKKALQELIENELGGNPSSIHRHGAFVRSKIASARETLAQHFGVWPEQLVFTSSGTEANQTSLRALVTNSRKALHMAFTSVEHDSVRRCGQQLQTQGVRVSDIPVGADGLLDWKALEWTQKNGPPIDLLSVGWVNAETGVIQDIERLVEWRNVHAPQTLLHVDAAQAWGKLPIEPLKLGVDFMAFSGHKIGAPSGIGLLWMKPRTPFQPLIEGSQEKYRRGGSENSLGVVGLGAAVFEVPYLMDQSAGLQKLRSQFERDVLARIPGTRVNGGSSPRVSNTSNISFKDVSHGESLVIGCDLEGFSVSAGSACSSGTLSPSHVLFAMGVPDEEARSSLRISLWHKNTEGNMERFVECLTALINRLRGPNRWKSQAILQPKRIWSRHS